MKKAKKRFLLAAARVPSVPFDVERNLGGAAALIARAASKGSAWNLKKRLTLVDWGLSFRFKSRGYG